MKKVVIYGRLDHAADNGEALDDQIRELEDYCRNKGYQVVRTVRELRYGRTVSPELLRVVADHAEIDALVVRDGSRICWSTEERFRYEQLLHDVGVEFECVNG